MKMRKRIISILGMVIIGLTACGGNETVSNSNTVEVMKNIEMESSEVEESSHNVEESNSNTDNEDIPTEQQGNEQNLTDNVSTDVQGRDTVTDIDANDGEYLETETETITTETQQAEQSEKAVAEQPKAEQAKQVVAEQPQVEQTQQPVVKQPSVEQSQQTIVEQPSVEQQPSVTHEDNTDHVGFDGINPYTGQPWKEGDVMPSGAIFQGDNTGIRESGNW